MLLPNKMKYRRVKKGRVRGPATSGNYIAYGQYALQAQGHDRVTSRQIEASRQAMTRYIKRGGKIWIRVFPHTPITNKPAEVRMGGGKGAIDHYAAKIEPGIIIFELDGVPYDIAAEAMRLAAMKLPVKTRFIAKASTVEESHENE